MKTILITLAFLLNAVAAHAAPTYTVDGMKWCTANPTDWSCTLPQTLGCAVSGNADDCLCEALVGKTFGRFFAVKGKFTGAEGEAFKSCYDGGAYKFSPPPGASPDDLAKLKESLEALKKARAALALAQIDAETRRGALDLTIKNADAVINDSSAGLPPPPIPSTQDEGFCSSAGCKLGIALGVMSVAIVGIVGYHDGWFDSEETVTVNLGSQSAALRF